MSPSPMQSSLYNDDNGGSRRGLGSAPHVRHPCVCRSLTFKSCRVVAIDSGCVRFWIRHCQGLPSSVSHVLPPPPVQPLDYTSYRSSSSRTSSRASSARASPVVSPLLARHIRVFLHLCVC